MMMMMMMMLPAMKDSQVMHDEKEEVDSWSNDYNKCWWYDDEMMIWYDDPIISEVTVM